MNVGAEGAYNSVGSCKGFCEDGLWKVDFEYPRISCKDYYINFMTAPEMVEKFKIFEKKHVGFYMQQYREEEPITHHHTFFGQKKD